MALFLSTFVNKIDGKGRVSVPATFRAQLTPQTFQGVVVYPSFTQPCIEGAGMDFMERLAASVEEIDLFSPEQNDLTQLIFSQSAQLSWDDGGRIMLPEEMLAHGGLSTSAAFVGKGQTFQIWEPEALRAYQAEARARALATRPSLKLKPQGA